MVNKQGYKRIKVKKFNIDLEKNIVDFNTHMKND